jgi:linoleoyl-CoA desaturase
VRYQKNGMAKRQNTNISQEWLILLGSKYAYVAYIFVLPVTMTGLSWIQVLFGIFIMQYITGFMLVIIFQPAHIVVGT